MNSDAPPLTHHALRERLPVWGLQVLESHHAADFHMEWQSHRFAKVIYVLAGSGKVLIRDGEHAFAPRNVVFVPPRHRNRIVDDLNAPASLYVLCVTRRLLHFDRRLFSRLPGGTVRLPVHLSNRVEKRLRRLLYQQSQPTQSSLVAMISDAFDVLGCLETQVRYARPKPTQVFDAHDHTSQELSAYVSFLEEHFFEPGDIDDAARMIGISRRAFTSAFRKATGESWLSHVNALRVQHACHLLRSTKKSITSIAFECGFSDLSTFYRRFHSSMKMSPGNFRESCH